MDNLKNLEKIAKVFQPQNIITSDEIDQVLKGIMEILASYKKGTDAINEETKSVVNILLDKVVQSNKQTIDKAETVLDDRMNDLESLLKDVSQMCSDMEAMMGEVKDGKDADEEKIVEDVVSRIKLEPTIVTLSAEEVRDRLSSLKDDARLDKSAIKGLDKVLQQSDLDYAIATLQQQTSFLINRGGVKSLTAGTNITITDNGGGDYTITASGGSGSGDVTGPSSATDNAITRFDGTTGKLIQNSTSTIDDSGVLSTTSTIITGTNGSGHINLRHQASDASATGQSTALFANSTGDIKWKNDGNFYTTLKSSTNTADRVYTFLDSSYNVLGSTSAITSGSILFADSTGLIAQDNSNLFWDDTNNRLGLLTTAPTHSLTFGSTSTGIALYGTVDQTTNYERIVLGWNGTTAQLVTAAGGSGTVRNLQLGSGSVTMTVRSVSSSSGFYQFANGSSTASAAGSVFSGTYGASSGSNPIVQISPTFTQTSTAGYTVLLINSTETTTGSGTKRLLDLQVGGTSRFSVANDGTTLLTSTAATQFTLAYDGSNSVAFQVSSGGDLTIDASGNDVNIASTDALRALGGLYTSSTNANSNLGVVSGSSGVGTTQTELLIGGAGSVDLRILERGSTNYTLAANRSYGGHIIGAQAVTEASSGTHALISAFAVKPVAITNGTATTTNGATVYIEAAATGTTPTNNYSLWVDDGTSRFDGAVVYTDNTITAVANAATVPVTARQHDITNNSAAGLTITLTTTGAVDGQLQLIRIFDFSAAAQTLTFVNTENSDVSVPATTNGSTTLPRTVGFMYNTLTSKWRCVVNV